MCGRRHVKTKLTLHVKTKLTLQTKLTLHMRQTTPPPGLEGYLEAKPAGFEAYTLAVYPSASRPNVFLSPPPQPLSPKAVSFPPRQALRT